jgi:hypothetical protein
MSKPIIKRIGDHEYRYLPYGFDHWLKLQAEVGAFGGPLIAAIDAMRRGSTVGLGPIVQELARELLGGFNRGLLDRFYSAVSVNAAAAGAKDRWQDLRTEAARGIWAGRYFEAYKVTEWLIEEAFVPFWTDVINDESAPWNQPAAPVAEEPEEETEEEQKEER